MGLLDLFGLYPKQCIKQYSSFFAFKNVNLEGLTGLSRMVKPFFSNNMHLFEYSLWIRKCAVGKCPNDEISAKQEESRLLAPENGTGDIPKLAKPNETV